MILVFLEQSFHVSWVSAVVEISAGYIADGRIYASCLKIPEQSHWIIFSELYWTRDFIAEELLNKVLHIKGFMNKELHVWRSLKKGLPKNALNYKGILHKWFHVQGYLRMDYIFKDPEQGILCSRFTEEGISFSRIIEQTITCWMLIVQGLYVQVLLQGIICSRIIKQTITCSLFKDYMCKYYLTMDYMFKYSWTRTFKERRIKIVKEKSWVQIFRKQEKD